MVNNFKLAEYVNIVVIVPETHADSMREVMGKAGAGKMGNYSFASFSVKGTGHFKPDEKATPFIGQANKLETVAEERIETICHKDILEKVVEEIKKAHPYENTVIDIFPIYEIGFKIKK
ncbi:MAG: hypothetical protein P4L22_07645 [Candidatus Babeliales bacterium]|nr:hypothetical protein [Candidatus Babeliales bacterium]